MGKQNLPGEISSSDMMSFLEFKGWAFDRQKGDHHIHTRAGYRSIPVPHPMMLNTRRTGLFYDILREADSNKKEFAAWYRSRG